MAIDTSYNIEDSFDTSDWFSRSEYNQLEEDYQDLQVTLAEYKDELKEYKDKYDTLVRDIRALYMENK